MEDCIFCKIANGEIKSELIYSDDEIVAFNDINPKAPIHILVIPRKHIKSVVDLTQEDERLIGKIYTVINKIAKEKNISEKGFRIVNNCGKDGGQEVPHLHFHILGGKILDEKII